MRMSYTSAAVVLWFGMALASAQEPKSQLFFGCNTVEQATWLAENIGTDAVAAVKAANQKWERACGYGNVVILKQGDTVGSVQSSDPGIRFDIAETAIFAGPLILTQFGVFPVTK